MTRPRPRQREDYAYFTAIQTRWNDNDQYGHLYNGIYAELFDCAMNQWLVERNMLGLDGTPLRVVVAENGFRFFADLSYPDRLEIGLRLEKLGNSSAIINFGMYRKGDPQERAQAHCVMVCVSEDGHRPTQWPDRHRGHWQSLLVDRA